jgi:hypothetical protein
MLKRTKRQFLQLPAERCGGKTASSRDKGASESKVGRRTAAKRLISSVLRFVIVLSSDPPSAGASSAKDEQVAQEIALVADRDERQSVGTHGPWRRCQRYLGSQRAAGSLCVCRKIHRYGCVDKLGRVSPSLVSAGLFIPARSDGRRSQTAPSAGSSSRATGSETLWSREAHGFPMHATAACHRATSFLHGSPPRVSTVDLAQGEKGKIRPLLHPPDSPRSASFASALSNAARLEQDPRWQRTLRTPCPPGGWGLEQPDPSAVGLLPWFRFGVIAGACLSERPAVPLSEIAGGGIRPYPSRASGTGAVVAEPASR